MAKEARCYSLHSSNILCCLGNTLLKAMCYAPLQAQHRPQALSSAAHPPFDLCSASPSRPRPRLAICNLCHFRPPWVKSRQQGSSAHFSYCRFAFLWLIYCVWRFLVIGFGFFALPLSVLLRWFIYFLFTCSLCVMCIGSDRRFCLRVFVVWLGS